MVSPTTHKVQEAVVAFETDFIKDNLHNAIDNAVEKAVEVAGPFLKNGVSMAAPIATTHVATFIKGQVTTKVPPAFKPIADVSIDAATHASEAALIQETPSAIDQSLETAANISKKVLKKSTDTSVDSTGSIISWFYAYWKS